RLPALGAEVHLTAPGERFAAVGALAWRLALLGQLERGARGRRLLAPGRFVVVLRGVLGGLGEGWGSGRGVGAIASQKPLGREPVEAQQGIGELAKQPCVGVLLSRLPLERFSNLRRLEPDGAPVPP